MAKPDPDAYRDALEAARRVFNSVREEEARRIERVVRQYARQLEARIANLGDAADVLAQARQINEEAADQLLRRLQSGTEEARATLFEDTLAVWQESGRRAAETVGITGAQLSAVRPPPVTLLGAFESTGGAETWRTLLRGHVSDAATEANAVMRQAFQEGVGFEETARRLRRYVEGSEVFDEAFEGTKLDLRTVSPELRGQAGQMRFNARRIAWSEMRNARHEAEVQHMIRDPLIGAIQWQLSPTHDHTDECDLLASADWYGLGPGIYPVGRVPAPPHPMDKCENVSLGRDSSEIDQPKPDPARQLDADQAQLPSGADITENAAQRARDRAQDAIERGERALEGVLEEGRRVTA